MELKQLSRNTAKFLPIKIETLRDKFISKGGSTLIEIYIGFCPYIDLHDIMHIHCLTYDYSICDKVFLLTIYMVKKRDVM